MIRQRKLHFHFDRRKKTVLHFRRVEKGSFAFAFLQRVAITFKFHSLFVKYSSYVETWINKLRRKKREEIIILEFQKCRDAGIYQIVVTGSVSEMMLRQLREM